jgi:hypothetical protein
MGERPPGGLTYARLLVGTVEHAVADVAEGVIDPSV